MVFFEDAGLDVVRELSFGECLRVDEWMFPSVYLNSAEGPCGQRGPGFADEGVVGGVHGCFLRVGAVGVEVVLGDVVAAVFSGEAQEVAFYVGGVGSEIGSPFL